MQQMNKGNRQKVFLYKENKQQQMYSV